MPTRFQQTWVRTFTSSDDHGDTQIFFEDIPTVVVQVQRDRKEPQILVSCRFYKASGPPVDRTIKPNDPPYITTATGLMVSMTPSGVQGSKTEAVTAIWPASKKPNKTASSLSKKLGQGALPVRLSKKAAKKSKQTKKRR
ncbi:hypothetical protein [Bradyrhizobium guangzhouense]|uniref:hypothetical protein n=1 Tax=Bradyrhizobium guangzhouense TaxID=1325095 RepID=UPI0010091133|nr:hypothetical protein [Bradyrhizobium guangzhouense]